MVSRGDTKINCVIDVPMKKILGVALLKQPQIAT